MIGFGLWMLKVKNLIFTLFTKKPRIVQIWGLLLIKLVVPSIGSMTQVLSSVRQHLSPAATLSSPMKLVSGYLSLRPDINIDSTFWSVSVTRSFGALFSLKYQGYKISNCLLVLIFMITFCILKEICLIPYLFFSMESWFYDISTFSD